MTLIYLRQIHELVAPAVFIDEADVVRPYSVEGVVEPAKK